MRVLIVKTSSMGDVVHAAPLATDIARRVPDVLIDWVVEEGFADIPSLHRSLRHVIPIAWRRWRKSMFASETRREMRAVRERLRDANYDVVIDAQGLLKSAWLTRWARGRATRVVGLDRASAREAMAAWFYDQRVSVAHERHAIDRCRALGAAALGYDVHARPQFDLHAHDLASHELIDAFATHRTAVLLTNASRPSKLWPAEHWREVERALAERGFRSVLFWGGASEEGVTRARAELMRNAVVAPRFPLNQVAAALARAQVVVGLDTGLAHLAAALGVPTVGIFCDYDPALVGITGDARCESLGGVHGGPAPHEVVAAIDRVLTR